MTELLPIKDLILDPEIQVRAGGINPEALEDYSLALYNGAEFPPIEVFDTDEGYIVADGFTRTEAHRNVGKRKVLANITPGTRRDAILFAISANLRHGQRLTNQDKRKIVSTLLTDDEWSKWSDNKIADKCSVSQPFVSKLRKELIESGEIEKQKTRLAKRGKDIYEIDVSNISDTIKNPAGRKGKSVDIDVLTSEELTLLENNFDEYQEEFIEEVEIPTEKLLAFSSVKPGETWKLGEHCLYINSLGKLKTKLKSYPYCLYFGEIDELIKNQKWILDKVDCLTVVAGHGEDVMKLIQIDLDYIGGTLTAYDGLPYYLGHFGSEIYLEGFIASDYNLFIEEIITSITEVEEHILIVDPPQETISIIQEIGRLCSVISLNTEYIQTELMTWESIYGSDLPATKA
jgi:hypothetical protein